MHPLRHPRNAIFVGLLFVVVGVIYYRPDRRLAGRSTTRGSTMLDRPGRRHGRSWPTCSSPGRRTTDARPMLEELWNSILELTAQFVIPDWGALIALVPVFIFVLVVLSSSSGRSSGSSGRRSPRRGKPGGPAADTARVPHARALVVADPRLDRPVPGLPRARLRGLPLLVVGASPSSLSLLYWLSESVRIYDHDLGERTRTDLPVIVHDGPPAGVHLPGPRSARSSAPSARRC